jgi:hypothetical protein
MWITFHYIGIIGVGSGEDYLSLGYVRLLIGVRLKYLRLMNDIDLQLYFIRSVHICRRHTYTCQYIDCRYIHIIIIIINIIIIIILGANIDVAGMSHNLMLIMLTCGGLSKSFRTGRLERGLKVLQLSATRCSCIAILWVCLVSFVAISLCVSSQRVFIVVVYFVIDSVRKLLDIPSYTEQYKVHSSCLDFREVHPEQEYSSVHNQPNSCFCDFPRCLERNDVMILRQ